MLLAIVLGTFAAAFGIYFGTGFVFASLTPLWKGIAQLVLALPLAFGAAIGVVIIGGLILGPARCPSCAKRSLKLVQAVRWHSATAGGLRSFFECRRCGARFVQDGGPKQPASEEEWARVSEATKGSLRTEPALRPSR